MNKNTKIFQVVFILMIFATASINAKISLDLKSRENFKFQTQNAVSINTIISDSGQSVDFAESAREYQQNLDSLFDKISRFYVRIGGGSGVIISKDGYVLTNHHVANYKNFMISLFDGRRVPARVIGSDPRGDISLLKLELDAEVDYAEIGDSDSLQIGDFVLAAGNPFLYGLDDSKMTLTTGIISGLHCLLGGYSDAIITDAQINPGNSGGPLLDRNGRILGINGRINVRYGFGTRINTGVGYAIPINQILRFVKIWLAKEGVVYHGLISGLTIAQNADDCTGAKIQSVESESQAEKLGFKKDDVITQVENRSIKGWSDFWSAIGTYPENWSIKVQILRGTEKLEIACKLEPVSTLSMDPDVPEPRFPAKPKEAVKIPQKADEKKPGYIGITIDLEADPKIEGLPVLRVIENSPASAAGIRMGDIILRINGEPMEQFECLTEFMKKHFAGEEIEILLLRDSEERTLKLTLSDQK